MNIHFPAQLEARLQQMAAESGRTAEDVVTTLLAEHLAYDDWFRAQVQEGLGSLDAGDSVSHDEVLAQFRTHLQS